MVVFISKFDYMPPGSYSFVPTELAETEIASMPPDRYLVLKSGTLLFWEDIPPELKKRFIKEFTENEERKRTHYDPYEFA